MKPSTRWNVLLWESYSTDRGIEMGNEGSETVQESVTKQKAAPRIVEDAVAQKPSNASVAKPVVFEEETETKKLTGVGAW